MRVRFSREMRRSMKQAKIVVVGSFNVDITGYAERLPRNGETVFGRSVSMGPGGKGFNQATGAHRAGADVVMIAGIGKDDFSGFAHRQFASEGLSEKYVVEMEESGTGCALIEVDGQSGENRIVVFQGANARLSRAHVRAAETEIASADLVLTQLETNLEAVDELKRLAQKHGKTLVLNPAPFIPVSDGFFEGVDVFTPNETEAEYYSGIAVHTEADAAAAAKKMRALGVKRVVITMGSRGAYCADEAECGMVASPAVKAIDTVGAGDAFTGALCTRLAEGNTLMDAARFAACFAALAVTRKGACSAMPTRAEAEALQREFESTNKK